jgi:hypothetical protein
MFFYTFVSCDTTKPFNSKEGKLKLPDYQDSISFSNENVKITTKDSIVNLLTEVLYHSKMSCKNRLTFLPKSVLISNKNIDGTESDTTYVFLKFEAKNSFGVPGELTGRFMFCNGKELEERRFIYEN